MPTFMALAALLTHSQSPHRHLSREAPARKLSRQQIGRIYKMWFWLSAAPPRFVTAWDSTVEDVDHLIAAVKLCSGDGA
jgi:threonine aldolase